jgi:hypothetical protein
MKFGWLNLVWGEVPSWTTSFGCVTPIFMLLFELKSVVGAITISTFLHICRHIHLVETGAALHAVQEKKLRGWSVKNGLELHWHESIEDVPTGDGVYTMLIAHELFDALPFHLIEVRRWLIWCCV